MDNARIAQLKSESHDDNRAIGDRLDILSAEIVQIQQRLQAKQAEAQQVNAEYIEREKIRRAKIDALTETESGSDG